VSDELDDGGLAPDRSNGELGGFERTLPECSNDLRDRWVGRAARCEQPVDSAGQELIAHSPGDEDFHLDLAELAGLLRALMHGDAVVDDLGQPLTGGVSYLQWRPIGVEAGDPDQAT
jgi:hypothetical protein